MNDPQAIRELLGHTTRDHPRTIAVIGLSDDQSKPSYYVSAYMQQQGYTIFPVNPGLAEVLGERCVPSLSALPVRPDVVNVFRQPKFLPAIVEEMIELGLRGLWAQQGIVHPEAAKRAEAAGIKVVMDHCIMVEHRLQASA